MRFSIPYGKETQTIETDEKARVLHPSIPSPPETNSLVTSSLSRPDGPESLEDFVERTTDLLIIVNDATRPSTTRTLLEHIHHLIGSHPSRSFLVATGTHPPPDAGGLAEIFGDLYRHYHNDVYCHDSRDGSNLGFVGTTSRGIVVEFDRHFLEADGVICIGNVKPHYFAGFTGGRKSFLPGIASYRTIEMNHSHAVHVGSQPLALHGNPLAEDMEEAARMLGEKRIFSIQTVVDLGRRLLGCFSGDLHTSFQRAADLCRQIYSVDPGGKANIVISANPYPMDINLYQAQHALENVKSAVEEGGIMVLVSKCWSGIGNPSFLELLDRTGDLARMEGIIRDGYRLGYHKAYRILKMREHADIWAVTDLPDDVIMRSRMSPFPSVKEALDEAVQAMRSRGEEPRVLVFPEGGMTVAREP